MSIETLVADVMIVILFAIIGLMALDRRRRDVKLIEDLRKDNKLLHHQMDMAFSISRGMYEHIDRKERALSPVAPEERSFRVLFGFADLPSSIAPALDRESEVKAILSTNVDHFVYPDITLDKLIDELCRDVNGGAYQVLDLSGHGTEEGFIMYDQEILDEAVLGSLLSISPVQLVTLRNCYSLEIARTAVNAHGVNWAIGISQVIPDDSAIRFMKIFYGQLFDRKILNNLNVSKSFRLAQLGVNAEYRSYMQLYSTRQIAQTV